MGIAEQGGLVTAIMIIVEIIKRATDGKVNRFLPLISLLLGVAGNVALNGFNPEVVVTGILIGGGASGIYDFGKKTLMDN